MRRNIQILATGLLFCVFTACAAQKSEAPAPKLPEFLPTATVREVMGALMEPTSDFLWNSVSTETTAQGEVQKAPATEDDWKQVRRQAVALMEATNLLLVPGRHVAPPGAKAQDDKVQLEPEQIEALISQDGESWTKFAHGLHDSVLPVLKAVDAKDVMGLSDAGDGIDKACESCHMKYWYPNEAKK